MVWGGGHGGGSTGSGCPGSGFGWAGSSGTHTQRPRHLAAGTYLSPGTELDTAKTKIFNYGQGWRVASGGYVDPVDRAEDRRGGAADRPAYEVIRAVAGSR